MIDSPYVAKRVQAGIPLWDITVRGENVGTLSDLPMEDSPMATVRYMGHEETFAADTVHGVLDLVGDHLASFDSMLEEQAAEDAAISEMEYQAEVIGPMRAAEDLAERYSTNYLDEDPIW